MKTFNELKLKYPSAYKHPRLPEGLHYELGCGEGWAGLLEPIIKYLHEYNEKYPDSIIHISQVKEKYGTLRFYTSTINDELDELINSAEAESESVCEVCGSKGESRKIRGWIQTLCDVHAQEKNK